MRRRLFAAILGSAPAVAAMPPTNPGPAPSPMPFDPRTGSGIMDVAPSPLELLRNKNRRDFNQAMSAGEGAFRKRMYRQNSMPAASPNIDALRSVSPQHKMIMRERELDVIKAEERTWLEALADKFGIDLKIDREEGRPEAGSQRGW